MDAMALLLQEELNRLLDRVAAETPRGTLEFTGAGRPDLRARAEALEAEITAGRADLLARYGRWREALDEYAGLWALASAHHAGIGIAPACAPPARAPEERRAA
jgi:hypothetical protein